jgi:hypothetical protein
MELPDPPIATEEENLKLASQMAAVNLLYAQREIAHRITDPTITSKGLLDFAEHSFKVSGMAKKQEGKEESNRFVFNIIMGDNETVRIEKTVEGETLDATETSSSLSVEAANLLVESVTFDTAPEF